MFRLFRTGLTYENAVKVGINDGDIRKPLLAFLLSTVYHDNEEEFSKLGTLTSNEYRSFIYLNFIHRLIEGKTQQRGSEVWHYKEEKQILRRIALLIKLFNEDLTENDDRFIKLFGLGNNEDSRNRLKQVLRDYFDIPLLPGTRERRVLFLHSTFKEYLMAENYLEILLTKDNNCLNSCWMNVTIPTRESVQFLEGLLGLIKKTGKSPTISKWVAKNNDNVGSLFNLMTANGRGTYSLVLGIIRVILLMNLRYHF